MKGAIASLELGYILFLGVSTIFLREQLHVTARRKGVIASILTWPESISFGPQPVPFNAAAAAAPDILLGWSAPEHIVTRAPPGLRRRLRPNRHGINNSAEPPHTGPREGRLFRSAGEPCGTLYLPDAEPMRNDEAYVFGHDTQFSYFFIHKE